MQPICTLHNYMFSDVMPHLMTSELCLFMNLTYHPLLSHAKGLSVIHHGLYVMNEGLPVMCEESVSHMP